MQGLLQLARTWTQRHPKSDSPLISYDKGASAGSRVPSSARLIKTAAISADRLSIYLDHFAAGLQRFTDQSTGDLRVENAVGFSVIIHRASRRLNSPAIIRWTRVVVTH
jgi:hypothetical protein